MSNQTLVMLLYILVMAGVTYLVRALPFVAFRKKIKSRYIRSMLYYLPYAVLSAMVLPGVFYSTGSVITAAAGFVVAIALAFWGRSLIIVALGASAAVYFCDVCMRFL
jgi:branched-subunit amino acid transport protein